MLSENLPRRPGPSVRRTVEVHHGERSSATEDRLATEEPLEIRVATPSVGSRRTWTTMRTPGHDFELAAGWMVNEGLATPGDIARVAYCTDRTLTHLQEFNVVTVALDVEVALPGRASAMSTGSSACGVCGKDDLHAVLTTPSLARWEGTPLVADQVHALPQQLRAHQALFDRTGGVHAAGLLDEAGDVAVVREDVGRHNAVDKVVGARVLAQQVVAAPALVVSGRAGFELVQKAVVSGMGALVAIGAPTSLAVDLARASGLVLWGFVDGDRAVRYS